MLNQGVLLQNRYRITRHIGGGGMGIVYLAEDTRLPGRQCAIKEMSPALLPPENRNWATNAFRQEAQILANLNHPGLTAVTDFFPERGNLYLMMEYVHGQTLQEILENTPNGRLSQGQTLNIVHQLCDVLEYLHTLNPPVIFRDLKPSNVMLTPDGQVKLIDFGIARLFKSTKSQDTVTLGTPGYAAPEQWGATGQSDARSDVYGLGVLLLQLVTGYDPTPNPFSLPQPRDVLPTISPKIEHLILRATPPQPGARYQSIAEFQRDIDTQSNQLRSLDKTSLLPSSQHVTSTESQTPHPFTQTYSAPHPSPVTPYPQPAPAHKRTGLWIGVSIAGVLLVGLCIVAIVGVNMWSKLSGTLSAPTTPFQSTETPAPTNTPVIPPTVGPSQTPVVIEITSTPTPPTETPSWINREGDLLQSRHYRENNGGIIFAYVAQSSPTIDGRLDEWGDRVYDISYKVHDPDDSWDGRSDLYGRFRIGWDVNNLYLGIEVTDDVHVQVRRGMLLYEGDDVEIQIDADLSSDFYDSSLSSDDGQVGLSAGDFGSRGPEAYIWLPANREQTGTMIEVATQQTDNGYTLEAGIPWWTLGGRPPVETAVGFCLSLGDNDFPGTAKQQTMVSTTSTRKWGDPTTWGTLILVDWK